MKKFFKFIFNLFLCIIIAAFVIMSVSGWETGSTVGKTETVVTVTVQQTPVPEEQIENVVEAPAIEQTAEAAQPEVEAVEVEDENVLKLTGEDGQVYELALTENGITVENNQEAEALIGNAQSVPADTMLTAGTEVSADAIARLNDAFGKEYVSFSKTVSGVEITDKTEEIDIYAFNDASAENVAAALKLQPGIMAVNLSDEEGTSCLSIEQLGQLQEEFPEVVFNYPITLFGQTFSTADTSVEYVEVEIGDAGLAQFREIFPYMTQLNYFKLDKCNVSSAAMAQMREDYPDIKVVWRIYFSYDGYNCLTDTKKIWATGTVTDGYIHDLMYCTDVKYLDMGHNCITNINFINYMPDLEVAVLSISWIADISPLANCKKLEFLEIYSSEFWDASPLAQCTSLKHLNLGNDTKVTDISALYDLDLERFYFNNSNVPRYQFDKYIELHPDCEVSFGVGHPVHGTWRFVPEYRGEWDAEEASNYYNDDYLYLREVIGYDTWDYSR